VRRKWTELPVLNNVIARVEEMSSSQDDDLEKILDDLNDSETKEENQDQTEEIVGYEADVDENEEENDNNNDEEEKENSLSLKERCNKLKQKSNW
jgi:hypothetical protein